MHATYAVLVTCLLGNICRAEQSLPSDENEATPTSIVWSNNDFSSSPPPPLKLDPVLRRALLRALTQLELEAQKKAGQTSGTTVDDPDHSLTDDSPLDEAQEVNIKHDLEELLGNYENTYNADYQTSEVSVGTSEVPEIPQLPEQQPQEEPVTIHQHEDTVELDKTQPVEVSVIDYEVPNNYKYNSTTDEQNQEDLQQHSTSSFVDKPEQTAIFFQNQPQSEPKVEVNLPNIESTPQIDIQSNIIPSSTHISDLDKTDNTAKRGSDQDSNALATSSVDKKTVAKSNALEKPKPASTPDDSKADLDDDQEVSIFQAPLVAAFTLEQDEKGNPKSVVPLFRRPQSIVNQQQQRLQQQSALLTQQQQSVFQQQNSLLTQQQFQQPSLPVPQQQQQRFQQQPLGEHRFQQSLEQQRLQQQPFQVTHQVSQLTQQQNFQPQSFQLTREQELERKTRLLEQQLQQFQQQQQQQFQQQQQQQQHFQQQQFLKQQQQFQQEQERLRQQRLFREEQQRLRLQQETLIPPPPPVERHRPQRQETGTAIVDFQRSVGFQFGQQPVPPTGNFLPQQPPFNNNFFQQSQAQFTPSSFIPQQNSFQNPPTNFASNNANSFRQPVQPPSLNSQLQSLLFQSGVAGDLQSNVRNGASPQEDLNIVSKVLSLNHEGRVNVSPRPGRESLELSETQNALKPPSRFISPPFL